MRSVWIVLSLSLALCHHVNQHEFTVISSDSAPVEPKKCRYRDKPLQSVANWIKLSCGGCYAYSNLEWFNQKLPTYETPFNNETFIFTQVDGRNFFFDYENEADLAIIASTFKNEDYYQKFLDCCHAAVDCCANRMTNENVQPTDEFPCPYIWDAWSCYPQAKNATISRLPCPSYTSSSTTPECFLESAKECFANGTWNQQTDYAVCSTAAIYRRRHNFHLYVLYTATALMAPAIIIFAAFERLHVLRLMLHLNLIVAIVLKNVTTILSKNMIVLDALKPPLESANVLLESGLSCKVLTVVDNIFKNAIFTSMFADGYYLHKMIARPLANDPNVYVLMLAVFVFSLIPSLVWMTLMVMNDKENCWIVDTDSWFQWITDGYKYAILAVNSVLLVNIFRVLLFKLQHRNSASTKAAFRAAILLVPLFGVPLIITSQRSIFDQNDCQSGDIYYYITYAVEGLQGILVATFFCYFNVEVKKEMTNFLGGLTRRIRQRIGDSNLPRRRRTTAMTNLRSSVAVIGGNKSSYRPDLLQNNDAFR